MIKTMSQNKKKKQLPSAIGVGMLAFVGVVGVLGLIAIKKKNTTPTIPTEQSTSVLDQTNQPESPPQVPIRDVLYVDLIRDRLNRSNKRNILVLGDSQAKRSIINQIKDIWGVFFDANYEGWAVEGISPRTIKTKHISKRTELANDLKQKLSQKPSVVYIQLGDNGIDTFNENVWLLQYINSFYSNDELPLIIWSGPFPLCAPEGLDVKYFIPSPCNEKDWKCFPSYQKRKKVDFTNKIKEAIAQFSNAFFVSPYDCPPFNIPNTKCFTTDGIHITIQAMKSYLYEILNRKVLR